MRYRRTYVLKNTSNFRKFQLTENLLKQISHISIIQGHRFAVREREREREREERER